MDKNILEFTQKISSAAYKKIFVKLILSKRVLKDSDLQKIHVKYIEVKEQPQLSFIYKYNRKDTTKNLSIEEGVKQVEALLGNNFLNAILQTTKEDVEIKYNKKRIPKILYRKPTVNAAPSTDHDNKKQRFINTKNNIYLKSLGVIDQKDNVIPKMSAKFKQIDKYIETVNNLLNNLNKNKVLKVVDMGSGKGYLTFALYDHLVNNLDFKINMIGIEAQENLVNFCNNVAKKANFTNLSFKKGTIDSFDEEKTDILIALHACDTATDDAIYAGIKSNADVIICAPCCHKQIRKQIKVKNAIEPLMDYGILQERTSELITDGLRALILNKNNYKTKIFEFVPIEYTGKNIMITAIKSDDSIDKNSCDEKINKLKNEFGIEYHYLEKLLENPEDQSWRNENPVCQT